VFVSLDCEQKSCKNICARLSNNDFWDFLVKVISAGSLDPQRAKKVNAKTRYAVFNKRYHNSLEQVANIEQRSDGPANVSYFNYILSKGWQVFLENERQDLLEVGCNNTTNAYQRISVFPLNTYSTAWIEAIETLGLAGETDELKKQVSYEVCARTDLPNLSDSEKEQLWEGLELNAALEKLGDIVVACLRGEAILKKWRMQHQYRRVLGN
jgi:hypothetical protein